MSELAARPSQAEEVYREQGTKLWRAVMSYSGDATVADEAVAEAFAQLLHRGEAVRDPIAWVWKAAFRIAAGELKRMGKHQAVSDETGYEHAEPLPEVVRAVRMLPPTQRAVVVMHDYADRPTREIADTLGITASTVRVHLSQARRKLRKMLEEER